ncbi:MAG: uracil-DNA glycosylase family 4 [Gammaproteobacteria bacterium]|jgi:uracil-DNA glycosylase family 4
MPQAIPIAETIDEPVIVAEAMPAVPTPTPLSTPSPQPVASIMPAIEFNLDSWDDINRSIHQCENCSLASSCTQKVPGTGNLQADLMIIGEGPGHDEDLKGEPFVGRSGLLLDKILQSIGLDRSQIFITNIVKCRPPNNRDPHKDEVKACDAFLRAQIKQIAPKVILSVGRVSAQSLLGSTDPVGKLIPQSHQLADSDIPVKVTYHPAYLLRNPASKAVVWQDMKTLQRMLNS